MCKRKEEEHSVVLARVGKVFFSHIDELQVQLPAKTSQIDTTAIGQGLAMNRYINTLQKQKVLFTDLLAACLVFFFSTLLTGKAEITNLPCFNNRMFRSNLVINVSIETIKNTITDNLKHINEHFEFLV